MASTSWGSASDISACRTQLSLRLARNGGARCQLPSPKTFPRATTDLLPPGLQCKKKPLLHLMLTKYGAKSGKYCSFGMHVLKKTLKISAPFFVCLYLKHLQSF